MKSNLAPVAVVESLEPRLAPAGTVILSTAGGVLTITGDAGNNGISITDVPATGNWSISDPTASGTTYVLNGVTQAAMFTVPAQNGIKATLGDGNDDMRIIPSADPSGMILTGVLSINAGKGNDTLNLGTSANQALLVQGAATIDMGDDTDAVSLINSALFSNTVDIKLGAGNDNLALSGSGAEHTFLKGLKIDVGAGPSSMNLTSAILSVSGGNLAITGAGLTGATQTVTINPDVGHVQGSVSISILAGNVATKLNSASGDQFRINGGVTVTTGAGDDTLLLTGKVMIAGSLSVDLKEGNNGFTTASMATVQLGAFTFKSGAGTDSLLLGSGASLDVLGAAALSVGGGTNSFNMGTGSFALGSFVYTGGAGTDTLTLSGSGYLIRGNATISTGAGTGNVTSAPTTTGAIGGNFLFTGGANFDNLSIDNGFSVAGSTILDLKESQNVVTFEAGSSSVLNSFLQKGGKGVDVLTINGVVNARGAVTFTCGEGIDTFSGGSFGGLTAGSFNLTAGATGGTTVAFEGPVFKVAGATVFNLGGGDNTCFFTGLTSFAAGSLTVTALAGIDQFIVTATDFDVHGLSTVNLGNGANLMNFVLGDGDFNSAFTYTGGTGNDTLTFGDSAGDLRINGGLTFKGGTGSNQLQVVTDTATIGAVNYAGDKGDDALTLGVTSGNSTRLTVLGGVVANFGDGGNELDITDTVVQGALVLDSKTTVASAEVDAFRIKQSALSGPVTINMGASVSSFNINDTGVRGAFLINTGAGADTVNLDTAGGTNTLNTWFDKVTINTGAGNDTIQIGVSGNAGNVFQRAVIVDGGADTDSLTPANNTFNGGLIQSSNIP